MDERADRLESTVVELLQAVEALQRRVERLERNRSTLDEHDAAAAIAKSARLARRKNASDAIAILSLIGRLFLVLAGGFFLRALTESGVLTTRVGLSIGFAYALLWLYFADRSGRRGDLHSATFHGLATALIAFPLLVEAATKFKVLPGVPSVIAVTVLCTAMLAVAWHRRLRYVAWIALLGALPTSGLLLAQTDAVAPYALFLIGLGVATLWLGYSLDWWGLRWPAALAANLAVIGVTMRVLSPERHDPAQVAILLQLTLLGAYVVSIAIRTLLRGRNVVPFEIAQTIAALIVGFGGALYLAQSTGILPATIGIISIVMGCAAYGVAVVFLDRRKNNGPNVYYYTTIALVHVIAGLVLVLAQPMLGLVLALLAVAAGACWSRFGRSFMLLHAAVYLVATCITTGTLAYSLQTLAMPGGEPWILPQAGTLMAFAACLLVAWWTSARHGSGLEIASALRLVIIVMLLAASSAFVIGFLGPVVAGRGDRSLDPGAFATLSTGVLALAALAVAWLSRQPRLREWAWLVYPLLVLIGLKMATQDFKHSRPATLFIAMALYGTALILAPRLKRVATARTLDPVQVQAAS